MTEDIESCFIKKRKEKKEKKKVSLKQQISDNWVRKIILIQRENKIMIMIQHKLT